MNHSIFYYVVVGVLVGITVLVVVSVIVGVIVGVNVLVVVSVIVGVIVGVSVLVGVWVGVVVGPGYKNLTFSVMSTEDANPIGDT
jgi:hypothetical protein